MTPMNYSDHLFVTPKMGAPTEDLGRIAVTPKPVRSGLVYFGYKGRQAVGIVALIDPADWERRGKIIPEVHVYLNEDDRPLKKPPSKRG